MAESQTETPTVAIPNVTEKCKNQYATQIALPEKEILILPAAR